MTVLNEIKKPITLLRKKKLLAKIPVSNALLYSWMDKLGDYFDPNFPKPIRLGNGRSVFWVEDEIDLWLETYLTQRNHCTAVPIVKTPVIQKAATQTQGHANGRQEKLEAANHV